ncbi:hypothetical protein MishRS11D_43810 (plasmid) [Methylomagnum ishizawai]|nr:hypothetical protein MishRS11D_43810 [Methylomagnum ishizawai]
MRMALMAVDIATITQPLTPVTLSITDLGMVPDMLITHIHASIWAMGGAVARAMAEGRDGVAVRAMAVAGDGVATMVTVSARQTITR